MLKRDSCAVSALRYRVQKIWRFLTSMRLGTFLLTATAGAGVVGTIIPQQEEPVFYLEMYGRALAPVFLKLRLMDVFHAAWFIGAAVLLGLNLIACSGARVRGKLKRLGGPELRDNIEQIKNCQRYRKLEVQGVSTQAAAEEIKSMLKSSKYRVQERDTKEGIRGIAAARGLWGHLGSPLLHLALVIIIAGSVVGGLYGKSAGYQTAVPGTIQLTRDGFPFDLEVENFQVDYYSDGSPSQYRSRLRAVSGENAEKEKTIAVNDPLHHQGVKVYQSSYGWLIKGNTSDGQNQHSFTVESGELLYLQGAGELALRVQFFPDYRRDEYGRPFSRSQRPLNPKIVYFVYSQGRPLGIGEADLGRAVSVGGVDVSFEQFSYFTGLMVKKDPGVPIVWTGFTLLMLGLGLHFYLRPQYVWVLLQPNAGGITVHFASEGLLGPGRYPSEEEFENALINLGSIKECPV